MIFLMISTLRSQRYTVPSAASLLSKTTLRAGDRCIIVDNDGTLSEIPGATIIKNERPRSFAENANFGLALSRILQDDLMLLNNDIIYTDGWLDFLEPDGSTILVPFCNQNQQYQCGKLTLGFVMDYEDYADCDAELEQIAKAHREASADFDRHVSETLISFFCVYIPLKLSTQLGYFDETFGRGGGEDVDYRLRSLQLATDVRLVRRSYVLHFMGRSTWRSGEAAQETSSAYHQYRNRFIEKWGPKVATFFLAGPNKAEIAKYYGLAAEFNRGDFRAILHGLSALDRATSQQDENAIAS